ncbi:MAG: DUF2110 family protein [Candidatus Heimdallarchaeaceae archaeon]
MLVIKTLQKSYNVPKHSTAKAIQYILSEELKELELDKIEVSVNKLKYIDITVEGKDEIVAKNLIINHYGIRQSISNINEGDLVIGRIVNLGKVKFGVFVDIGAHIGDRVIDALYPLFEMRNQLTEGNPKSLMEIIKGYGLIENLPLKFTIVSKSVLKRHLRIKMPKDTIEWLISPLKRKRDALIICGATRRMIKQALIKTGHWNDIEDLERLGVLEYRIICKKGTHGDGLIPEIGGFLNKTKIGGQLVSRYEDLLYRRN